MHEQQIQHIKRTITQAEKSKHVLNDFKMKNQHYMHTHLFWLQALLCVAASDPGADACGWDWPPPSAWL